MKFGKYISILSAMALGLSGCLRDDVAECPAVPGGSQAVAISMNVPTGIAAATRAAVDDEARINTLDILVYKYTAGTSDNTVFVELIRLDASDLGGTAPYKTARVNVTDASALATDRYSFVLLANLRGEISFDDQTLLSLTKTQLLSQITFDVTETKDWSSVYLPMWGESEFYHLNSATAIPTVQMLRSLARMELALEGNASALLVPSMVMIPYQYNKGAAAPVAANYDVTTRSVTAPTLAGTDLVGMQMIQNPPLQVMYLAEYDKSAANEFCLLMEARYNGSGDASWYKVALRDAGGQPMDILRNHTYTVTIDNVTGPGYPSYLHALESNTYLQAEVKEWNNAAQNVVFDGNYFLEVSHPSVRLYKENGYVTITAETNYPGAGDMSGDGNNFKPGVSIKEVTGAGSWLTYTSSYDPGGRTFLNIRLAWSELASGSRSAVIVLKAGNMEYSVKVTQTAQSWLTATPEPVYLLDGMFHSVGIQSDLDWSFVGYDSGEATWAGTYFRTVTENGSPSTDKLIFKLAEAANTSDLLGRIHLLIEDESGYNYPTKLVPVWLTPATRIAVQANSYLVTPGVNETLVIMSRDMSAVNWAWGEDEDPGTPVTVWRDASGVVASLKSGGTGPDSFLRVRVGSGVGNAVVAITDHTNSIMWNWHIWSSVEADYIEKGVTENNGIVWMDRNLGALTSGLSVSGEAAWKGTFGLYYQFGRKDPFPSGDRDYWAGTDATPNVTIPRLETAWESARPASYVLFRNPFMVASTGSEYSWVQSWDAGGSDYKTIFDPCPPGWRVPRSSAWYNDSGFSSGANGMGYVANGGVRLANNGSYYPLQGYRYHGTSTVPVVDRDYTSPRSGSLWTATPVSVNGTSLNLTVIDNGTGTVSASSNVIEPYTLLPIRCVKE